MSAMCGSTPCTPDVAVLGDQAAGKGRREESGVDVEFGVVSFDVGDGGVS